jgi:hypothetical protein
LLALDESLLSFPGRAAGASENGEIVSRSPG